MEKRIVKKYRLKESVQCVLSLGIIVIIIITTLLIQIKRVEDLDNTEETERTAVNVNINR